MRTRGPLRRRPTALVGWGVISVLLALAVLGCGGGGGAKRSSSSASRAAAPAWRPGRRAVARDDMCTVAGRAAVAHALRVPVSTVAERRAIARSGAPECVFSARGAVLSVAVDGAPQAYAVMERGAEEQAQIFGAKRFTPAPQLITGEGVGSYWFPAEHLVMTTEGVNLVTATIERWPGTPHRRWKRVAAAAARPYLGRVTGKALRGPAP